MIHPKYEAAFASLSAAELQCCVEGLSRTHPDLLEISDFDEGQDLVEYCRASRISQAEVIMSLARDLRVEAVTAVEKLIMRPIDRRSPAQVEQERDAARPRPTLAPVSARVAMAAEHDSRIIRVLAEKCPKRAGTKSAELWALYRDGMSIAEYLGNGGTRAALQWDQERVFIRIEDPQVSPAPPPAASTASDVAA